MPAEAQYRSGCRGQPAALFQFDRLVLNEQDLPELLQYARRSVHAAHANDHQVEAQGLKVGGAA